MDASSEWGDNPGEGPGIGEEDYVNTETFSERIGGFFRNLFGGNHEELNNNTKTEEENSGFEEETFENSDESLEEQAE